MDHLARIAYAMAGAHRSGSQESRVKGQRPEEAPSRDPTGRRQERPAFVCRAGSHNLITEVAVLHNLLVPRTEKHGCRPPTGAQKSVTFVRCGRGLAQRRGARSLPSPMNRSELRRESPSCQRASARGCMMEHSRALWPAPRLFLAAQPLGMMHLVSTASVVVCRR
jgi:hypothetical protein